MWKMSKYSNSIEMLIPKRSNWNSLQKQFSSLLKRHSRSQRPPIEVQRYSFFKSVAAIGFSLCKLGHLVWYCDSSNRSWNYIVTVVTAAHRRKTPAHFKTPVFDSEKIGGTASLEEHRNSSDRLHLKSLAMVCPHTPQVWAWEELPMSGIWSAKDCVIHWPSWTWLAAFGFVGAFSAVLAGGSNRNRY